jgi:transposase
MYEGVDIAVSRARNNYVFNIKMMGTYRTNIGVNGGQNDGPFQIIDKTNEKYHGYVCLAQGHDGGCKMLVILV